MASTSQAAYPPPLITPPLHSHKQSFIVLHGRGDNAETFGTRLLARDIPALGTLREALPNAKFIFPTASKRRARVLNNATVNQWFDIRSIFNQDYDEELQLEGLQESTRYIHGLLRAEIEAVGAKNVVLWGLSQGCAISLIATLTWTGEPFAADIGMCGWLPLRKRTLNAVEAATNVLPAEDYPLAIDANLGAVESVDAAKEAFRYLTEELELETKPPSLAFKDIPVFLGHGTADPKVPIALGRDATEFFERLGRSVEWREYAGLAHWYSGEMLGDIVKFLKVSCGLGNDSDSGRP